jgi:hypothetical protein
VTVSWSSALVGSSQTISRGSWTSARAMATRCCLSAGQLRGQRVGAIAQADLRQHVFRF